jgi:hypothetical protein
MNSELIDLYYFYHKNLTNNYSIFISSIISNCIQYFPFIKKYKIKFYNEKGKKSLVVKLSNNTLKCYFESKNKQNIKIKFYLTFNEFKLLCNSSKSIDLNAISLLNRIYYYITNDGNEPFKIKIKSKINPDIKILSYKTLDFKKNDIVDLNSI